MVTDLTVYQPPVSPQAIAVMETALSSVSVGSRPMYSHALEGFLDWHYRTEHIGFYDSVVKYMDYLQQERKLATATVNQHLSAIRQFFRTAVNMEFIPDTEYRRLLDIKNVRSQGQRTGNWLSHEDSQKLLLSTDPATLKGRRDRAILAVFLGCMVRRSEIAKLTWEHLVEREGTWRIENLLGKHNRTRSIPMPQWVKQIIEWYTEFLPDNATDKIFDKTSTIFVRLDRHGNIYGQLTPHGIWNIVAEYADKCGLEIAPHDLRRTSAKEFKKAGGSMRDLQLILGHASPATTDRYLDDELDFTEAASLVSFDTGIVIG